jgi:rhamnosyltransferase
MSECHISVAMCTYNGTRTAVGTGVSGLDPTSELRSSGKISVRAPTRQAICAVVVTYHPDLDLLDRIRRTARQVDRVVVVDNASPELCLGQLRELAESLNVHLILNGQNEGVAHALNQGSTWAAAQGYAWAFTLDQDTVVNEDAVETLRGVYEDFPEKEALAILGANFTDSRTGRPLLGPDTNGTHSWREEKTVITSGSLVSLLGYSIIGPFREEFFIDCVDWEYCLRARSLGFRIVLACKPLMQHSIGATSMHRLLWKVTGTSNHSPTRRYYMTRNLLALGREYLFIEPGWVFSSLYTYVKLTVAAFLFEEDRLPKLKYFALGAVDGLLFNFTRNLLI